MSFFVACFGIPHDDWSAAAAFGLKELMGVEVVHDLSTVKGSILLYGGSEQFVPKVHVDGDDGWVVLQGVAVDVKSADACPRLDDFLSHGMRSEAPDFDRYEGCFAVALWDARRSLGWFCNDHASVRNLYYCEHDGVIYVTTAPVVLAKSLSLPLGEFGVQQLLTRGCILSPTSLFEGMYRVSVGEHGRVSGGRLEVRRDWIPCCDPTASSLDESANAFVEVLTDRMRRLRVVVPSSIADLTGGLDSRVVNLARHFVGDHHFSATVNGEPSDADVQIAKELACVMGWSLRCFSREEGEITGDVRHELSIRTAGELAFDRISFHRRTRPVFAEEFGVHFGGGGGELLRYYPWSHEFTNIGRRKRADVTRTLSYRYSQFGEPPRQLFSEPWFAQFQDRLAHCIGEWFDRMPGTLTTQQQDALYVWKMTSHSTAWNSSTAAWIPSMSPLLLRGCVDSMVAIPWKQKLTSKLQRRVNHWLSPKGAAVRTTYGSPGGDWGVRDIPAVAGQTIRQATYMASKVLRVLRKKDRPGGQYIPPFLTAEFRDSMTPRNMVTSHLYDTSGLCDYLTGSMDALAGRAVYLARIATIEHVARAIV